MGNKANFSITPDKARKVDKSTNELQIFENAEFGSVRTTKVDGEPWFVGKDVCEVFGDTNYRRSLANIDDYDKGVSQIDTAGGKQNMVIINESGLYSLLFQMQPQKAKGVSQNDDLVEKRIQKLKRFKRWVTSEVLPSIRKNGGYIVGQETLSDDELLAKAFVVAKNKIAERDKRIKALEQEAIEMNKTISQMQPKVNYVDVVLQSKSTVCTTQIAQDYGMSAKAFNKILKNLEIQRKVGDQWILYAKYQGKGYVHSDTVNITRTNGQPDVKMNTKWTQKGRLFLYEKLKENGYIPLIEVNVA